MANAVNGEVDFEARGRTWTLRFSANAICELEEKLDRSVVSIASEMETWIKNPALIRMKLIRAVFWAGLQDHHKEVSVIEAGDIIIESGGIIQAMMLISEAFGRAFPSAQLPAGTKGEDPTNVTGLIGPTSIPPGSGLN